MKTIIHEFEAGTYYIGDPCYAVKCENWSSLLKKTDYFENGEEIFLYNGLKCFAAETVYGDGGYLDQEGREYGVDAGLLAIMPLSVCDGDNMYGGNITAFLEPFDVYVEDGVFHFGDVTIDTN